MSMLKIFMMRILKTFVSNILLLFVFLCCLSLVEQAFAGFHIHVSGAVRSYKNGMYQVKTKRGLIKIQASKLSSSLNKEINRKDRSENTNGHSFTCYNFF